MKGMKDYILHCKYVHGFTAVVKHSKLFPAILYISARQHYMFVALFQEYVGKNYFKKSVDIVYMVHVQLSCAIN